MTQLERIQRRSRRTEKVSEVVAREIVHSIVDRDLARGDMLPSEATMLEEYDVGRASLREALRILEVHGIITIKPGPGGGPVVAGANSRDFGKMATLYFHVARATFAELMEARLVMEPVMARLAAERRGESIRELLEDAVEDMDEAIDDADDAAYLAAATDFHGLIAGVSGNRVLDLYGRAIKDVYTDRLSQMVFPAESREQVAKDHAAIAKAIFKGSASRAETLMREHMVRFRDQVTKQFPGMMSELVDWR